MTTDDASQSVLLSGDGLLPGEWLDEDVTGVGGDRAPASLVSPPPAGPDSAPHLRRVWFRNFKGYEEFTVGLGRFNVLAGANNAGKSTLLQGIDLMYSLLKVHAVGDHLQEGGGKILNAAILPVAAPRDLFFHGVIRRGNVVIPAVVGGEFEDGSEIEFGVRSIFGSVNSRVERNAGVEGPLLESLLAHPAVWVPGSVGIVRDEEFRTAARQRGLISAGRHNEVLRNLLVALHEEHPERFDTLQRVLRERFDARLEGVHFDGTLDQFVSADYADDYGTRHDLYSAGAGFVQVVQMLAFMLTREASVILLDEPDAHLHSALQRVVVEILDEVAGDREFQVILSTHSKEIINFVDPSRLILIEVGATCASPVSTAVTPVTILKSLGAIDNVDAYALVANRRCLFVEGTTDVTILGRFAATMGVRALTGDDRVVTVPTTGSDNDDHLQQLDVLEGVLGVPLETLQIKDRDGRSEDRRQELMGDAKRPLRILERDCIESYLVHPGVLARVIVDASRDHGKMVEVDETEVAILIDGIAKEIRLSATDRLSQRYIVDQYAAAGRRIGVAEANEYARRAMEDAWGCLESKLTVLPGKALLGRIRRTIQENYSVSFGNERLAEGFRRDEIPVEIVGIMNEITNLKKMK